MASNRDREGTIYEVKVQGALDQDWQQWFNSRSLILQYSEDQSPITTITIFVPDQSALRGILGKLWDLNLTLISLQRLETPRSMRRFAEGESDDSL